MRGRRPRLADVARAANVSITTVSHVVNGTRFVAPETRSRVEQAVRDLDYRRDEATPQSTHPGAIGLAITGASNPYVGELIQGIESELSRTGQALLLCDTHDDPDRETHAVATLLAHNVEAVLIAPSPGWKDGAQRLLAKHHKPYVLVDRLADFRCDQIGAENVASTASVIDHLIELGHRRIGFVAGLEGLATSTERITGYRRAHRIAGVSIDESLIVHGGSSTPGGQAATLELLRRSEPPTAIFSGNNAMTIGVLRGLRKLGRRVPDDVALVAFDDFDLGDELTPSLTAVAQPFHAIGAGAVQLLNRRLADPVAPRKIVRMPAEIMHRHSCGCTTGSP